MILRSQIIERSLRCLRRGFWSFAPLLGLVFGPGAVWEFYVVATGTAERWNPARRHLYAGVFLGLAGFLLNTLVVIAALVVWFRRVADG